MGNKELISTLQPELAAFLETFGIHIIIEPRGGRSVFFFPRTDEVYCLMEEFNNNKAVPVTDFISRLKVLKAKMYSVRTASENGITHSNERR